MTTKAKKTASAIEAEFDECVWTSGIDRPSWYEATELIKRQIQWLEYVPEGELTEAETECVVAACRKAYLALRILTVKYID